MIDQFQQVWIQSWTAATYGWHVQHIHVLHADSTYCLASSQSYSERKKRKKARRGKRLLVECERCLIVLFPLFSSFSFVDLRLRTITPPPPPPPVEWSGLKLLINHDSHGSAAGPHMSPGSLIQLRREEHTRSFIRTVWRPRMAVETYDKDQRIGESHWKWSRTVQRRELHIKSCSVGLRESLLVLTTLHLFVRGKLDRIKSRTLQHSSRSPWVNNIRCAVLFFTLRLHPSPLQNIPPPQQQRKYLITKCPPANCPSRSTPPPKPPNPGPSPRPRLHRGRAVQQAGRVARQWREDPLRPPQVPCIYVWLYKYETKGKPGLRQLSWRAEEGRARAACCLISIYHLSRPWARHY